jgi:hypothetical protein
MTEVAKGGARRLALRSTRVDAHLEARVLFKAIIQKVVALKGTLPRVDAREKTGCVSFRRCS